MAYSTNPYLPKARKWAIQLVLRDGLPVTVAARKAGVHRTTLWRWLKKWHALRAAGELDGRSTLPTTSSRPHTSPRALPLSVVARITYWRERLRRCASVVHAYCLREGTLVSLASVKRILRRLGYTGRRRWQRYRPHIPRPRAETPGSLLQADTIHYVHPLSRKRMYVYTLIDVHSRWAYAEVADKLGGSQSVRFLQRACLEAPFKCTTVQADNGPEFGRHVHDSLKAVGIQLRHSRVRKPNDNAHVERFNRTLQEECLGRYIPENEPLSSVQVRLKAYLDYYNQERLHLGIQLQTPAEMLQRC